MLKGEDITRQELNYHYEQFRIKANNTFKQKQFNNSLLNNSEYQYTLDQIRSMFKPLIYNDFELRISRNTAEIILIENKREVSRFVVSRKFNQDELPREIRNWAVCTIDKINNYLALKSECIRLVNGCKNRHWGMVDNYLEFYFDRAESNNPYKHINMSGITFDNYDNIDTLSKMKTIILSHMNSILDYLENVKGIRVMGEQSIE